MTRELSDQAISEIKEAVRGELEDQRLKFWIEPEEHYRQHVALESLLSAYNTACTFIARGMIGLAVVGIFIAILVAVKFGRPT